MLVSLLFGDNIMVGMSRCIILIANLFGCIVNAPPLLCVDMPMVNTLILDCKEIIPDLNSH